MKASKKKSASKPSAKLKDLKAKTNPKGGISWSGKTVEKGWIQ
jgi:hypothetical protein